MNQEHPLQLPYSKRNFRIRFATDSFAGPDQVRFRSRLEGVDANWTPFFTDPIWQSGSLNEGRYHLHVIARDSDGADSREFALTIGIKPPWYRTKWMYFIYASGGVVLPERAQPACVMTFNALGSTSKRTGVVPIG